MEGSLSQIFYLGPSFNLMQSRKKKLKKITNEYNVRSTSLKCHYCGIHIKQDIYVQKIKVEKLV